MIYLLDVNILIALIDPTHLYTPAARYWFQREGQHGWATCPMTENGVVRIVGQARYPNSPGSPAAVADILSAMTRLPGHHFWEDNISLVDGDWIDSSRLLTSAQVTDSYLLGLAASRHGKLATFDRRLVTAAVRGGDAALHLLSDGSVPQ